MHCTRLIGLCVVLLAVLWAAVASAAAGDGNRLAYLDQFCNPYYPGLQAARLTVPQWIGEADVQAVVVLSIDDMSNPAPYENYLRPILDRLKQIDGRAPVSIMTMHVEPNHPQLQAWLAEGLSIEAHTYDHPCPCLQGDDFDRAKATYDRSIDQLWQIPNTAPIAFRMPCCDSMNSMSPRFFAEIFNRTTPAGNFLRVNSSVFTLLTPNDPSLPRELVFDEDGRQRFNKYVPRDRNFVNYIEDYPYPYVIGRLCWEIPSAIPDDWQGHNRVGPHDPTTLADMKAALDATVLKQGVFTLTFHPGAWIRSDQVVELVGHAVAGRPGKVKFLNFREVHERLTQHLLGGHPLRTSDGRDNGVRVLDVNHDGYMDVVIGNEKALQTRLWNPETGRWTLADFPVPLVGIDRQGNRYDGGVRFGVLKEDGHASILVRAQDAAGLWHFDGRRWVEDPHGLDGLEIDGAVFNSPVFTSTAGRDRGVRLHDLDGDGRCELIVGNPDQRAVFRWQPDRGGWKRLPFALPESTVIVDAEGRDAGLRLVDVDVDGHPDVVFSNAERYIVARFTSIDEGWSQTMLAGRPGDATEIPPIVRADGTNNGAWFKYNHMWVQNEQTGGKTPDQMQSRHFTDLLGTDREPPPRSPDDSLQSMEVAAGFKVELVACEPMVMDPVDLGFGPDGKLWIAEFADYPLGIDGHGKPGGRIRFLEDTNGDGRYDRSTVFLEPVASPTGVMPWRNGVLVTAAPEIFYAEDTDGDGRADVRRTLFSGFNEGNQQHRVNHPRWGLDNWVHAANGDSNGTVTSLETGRSIDISGRDVRFKPDEGLLDLQAGQTQFGTNRDAWGNWFGCNNPNPGWLYALADHYIRRNPHVAPPPGRIDVTGDRTVYPVGRVISHCDLKHRSHAAWGKPGNWTSVAGLTIYGDDLFGPHFAGNMFVSDSVFNVIHRRILEPVGTHFRGRRGPDETRSEFLASHDVWSRFSTLETGPDGALWVLDMYRFVIEHPEWIDDELEKTLDLRAGHDKGRIYRIYPVGKPPRPIPRLDTLDTAGLVAALDSPNGWQRSMAQQMLLWRADPAAVGPLEETATTSKNPLARLHALCALDGLRALRPQVAIRAMADGHPGVRRHAVRVCEPLLDDHPALGEALLKLEEDTDPHVQMQLAYTLGECSDPRTGRLLGRMAVRHEGDPYLTAAVMSSAMGHLEPMIAQVMADRSNLTARAELIGHLLNMALASGDQPAMAGILDAITAKPADGYAPWQYQAMARFLDELDRRKTTIGRFRADGGEELDRSFQQAVELFDAARDLATDENAAAADRMAAMRILGRGLDRQEEDLQRLVELLVPQTPLPIQLAAIESMGRLRHARVPEKLLQGWSGQVPQLHNAVLDVLLSRKEWVGSLLDWFESRPETANRIDPSRRDRLLRHPDEPIRRRAEKLLGSVTTSDEIRQSLEKHQPVTNMTGDPIRGKDVFVEATCAQCHKLGETGQNIATDLRTLVDKSPSALLVALIDPNRAVEDKYIEYIAETTDGLTLSGMVLEETSNSITLADTAGKPHVILRKNLEEFLSTGRSHMPEKLEAKLQPQQMADLFAFIARAGPVRREVPGNRPALVTPDADGSLNLAAAKCEIYGPKITIGGGDKYLLWFYDGPADHVVWSVEVARAGRYEVWIEWAQVDEYADNPIALEVEGSSTRLTTTLPSTGGWSRIQQRKFGEIDLPAGQQRIRLRPAGPTAKEVADLRGVRLIPIGAGK